MNKRTMKATIGAYDGASLVLQTARARVEVFCMDMETRPDKARYCYFVRGDIPPHLKGAELSGDVADAVGFAFECLAAYNEG